MDAGSGGHQYSDPEADGNSEAYSYAESDADAHAGAAAVRHGRAVNADGGGGSAPQVYRGSQSDERKYLPVAGERGRRKDLA